nr:PAS domain S-box protein [uncultured Desulfobacter sp.]
MVNAVAFSDGRTFIDFFAVNIPPYSMFNKFSVFILCMVSGLYVSSICRKQKRGEEALRASEESLRGLVSALPIGVGTLKDRVLTSANERMWEITGYPPDEIIGHETCKLYADKDEFKRVGKEIYSKIARVGCCFVNTCWRRKDGLELNVLIGAAVAHKGAESTDIVLSVMDITEQHEKEAWYRLLFEEAHDGLLLMDEHHFVDCNASALRAFGVARERIIGASPFDFSPEKQPDGTESEQAGMERINAALAGEPQVFEWRHLRGDGVPIDAEISLNCIQRGGKQYLLATNRDITERNQMLKALHESEEYLTSIFRTVRTGIGVVADRSLETVNDRFCEIFGYARKELVGDLTRKLYVSEEEFQRCGKAIYGQLEQKGISTVEAHMVRKDGREVHVRIDSTRLASAVNGNTVISSILDITALKHAEDQLRASEERFKALHNASFGGISIHDKGVILDCNQGLADITGYRLDELIGMDGLRLIADQSRELVMGNIKSRYEEPYEAMGVRKNGEEYPLRLEGKMIPYQGKTMRVVEFRDITESKRTLKALQENEQFLASIFRSTPTGIGVCKNRVVMTVNDRFCKIFGYPREEIVGQDVRMLYASEEEYQRCGQEIYEDLEKYGYGSIEALGRHNNGKEIHVLLNMAPLPADEEERVISLNIMDITEWKKNEEALRRYKDELEEMVKERTEELMDSNAELQRLIEASDDRSEQTAILNEMGELLQACETEEETYRVAVGVCAKLFPKDSGCLGILDEDNWSINVVGSWGDGHSCNEEFAHNDCWAIRRGKAHMVLEPDTDPLCIHVRKKPACGTICVPMNAQGKVLGMAHMLFDSAIKEYKEPERRRILQEKRLLLGGLVERYAPSLVNLRLRESLREQSIRDRLTGLFNRRHMEEALNCELARARRRGASLVVIMIDVDHFKRFNDTYGHETGDEVLRKLGGFLTSTVRMEDIPCRYGGEELMLILPECTMKDGLNRAEEVRRGIEKDVMVVHNKERLQVTASLGVASFPLDGENMESLIAAADKALYRAKEAGRNKVVAYKNQS